MVRLQRLIGKQAVLRTNGLKSNTLGALAAVCVCVCVCVCARTISCSIMALIRRNQGEFIQSIVFGGLDGIITTFAIVIAAAAAGQRCDDMCARAFFVLCFAHYSHPQTCAQLWYGPCHRLCEPSC